MWAQFARPSFVPFVKTADGSGLGTRLCESVQDQENYIGRGHVPNLHVLMKL